MAFPAEKYVPMKATSPKSDVVKFEFNLPQLVALKYPQPKLFQNQWGERAMYSLTDGRVMFVEVDVAESIRTLNIEPNEPFFIAKRKDKAHGPNAYYDVWRDPAKTGPATELEVQLLDSMAYVEAQKVEPQKAESADGHLPSKPPALISGLKNGTAAASIPSLESAWAENIRRQTQFKLTVYHELCTWAKENLEGITRNEVRAILMNVMISAERSR